MAQCAWPFAEEHGGSMRCCLKVLCRLRYASGGLRNVALARASQRSGLLDVLDCARSVGTEGLLDELSNNTESRIPVSTRIVVSLIYTSNWNWGPGHLGTSRKGDGRRLHSSIPPIGRLLGYFSLLIPAILCSASQLPRWTNRLCWPGYLPHRAAWKSVVFQG